MVFCIKCGFEISDESTKFCSNCGTNVFQNSEQKESKVDVSHTSTKTQSKGIALISVVIILAIIVTVGILESIDVIGNGGVRCVDNVENICKEKINSPISSGEAWGQCIEREMNNCG